MVILILFIDRSSKNDPFYFAFCGILAVATTLSNVTILIVLFTNKKLMNAQAVHRISLAMSDVFTGIVVFPSFISTNILFVSGNISQLYINTVGFFIMLNLHVSIFTLAAAAIDRFKVVCRPLRYNFTSSTQNAKKICLGLWLMSITLCLTPFGFVVESFIYELYSKVNFVIPSLDSNFVVIYVYGTIAFLLPLLTMWIFTILTFVMYKKHSSIC